MIDVLRAIALEAAYRLYLNGRLTSLISRGYFWNNIGVYLNAGDIIVELAAQAWVKDFEHQHPRLIALLDGVETEDEALARLSGLSLEELLSL